MENRGRFAAKIPEGAGGLALRWRRVAPGGSLRRMRIVCPMCRKVIPDAPDDYPSRPFCSRQCKLQDLGKWLDGEYRIPGEPVDPESLPSRPPGDAEDE